MKIYFQRHLMNFWSFAADFQGSFLQVSSLCVLQFEIFMTRSIFHLDLGVIDVEHLSWFAIYLQTVQAGYGDAVSVEWSRGLFDPSNVIGIEKIHSKLNSAFTEICNGSVTLQKMAPKGGSFHSIKCIFHQLAWR